MPKTASNHAELLSWFVRFLCYCDLREQESILATDESIHTILMETPTKAASWPIALPVARTSAKFMQAIIDLCGYLTQEQRNVLLDEVNKRVEDETNDVSTKMRLLLASSGRKWQFLNDLAAIPDPNFVGDVYSVNLDPLKQIHTQHPFPKCGFRQDMLDHVMEHGPESEKDRLHLRQVLYSYLNSSI